MKYHVILPVLLTSLCSFSQSKKELRRQLAQKDSIIEAQSVKLEKQKQLEFDLMLLRAEVGFINEEMSGYVMTIDSLNTELYNCQSAMKAIELRKTIESKHDSPKQKSETPNPNNPSPVTNDPFGGGGTNNDNSSGNAGSGGGTGNGIGYDDGTGQGPGYGTGGLSRKRINNMSVAGIQVDESATIHMKLTIDAKGNVVSASNIKSKTTTTNQVLINRILSAVKAQVKYNRAPGASLTNVFYTVKVVPN